MTKLTIEEMQRIAEERDGVCLSKEYINNRTHLLWECKNGHKWKAMPTNIRREKWCPFCAGSIKLTLQDMEKLARNYDGKFLSKEYINARTKIKWECSEGHQWKAYPYSVKSGHWCPKCGRKSAADLLRHTIEDMKKVAKERGGRCLSDNYVNARRKLMWECAEGHHWETTPSSILAGRWCHECSTGLGERICREFFEQLFENKFPKAFPKWLINESGNQMELDGYCKKLDLAFEHQGEQHYTTRTPYIKTKANLSREKKMTLGSKNYAKKVVLY